MNEETKRVILMRALPGCGKSHMAHRLAGDRGVVLETDEYFTRQIQGRTVYQYCEADLPEARRWNLSRFHEAIRKAITPIVIDRGNGLNDETKAYATYAIEQGYQVEIAEPDSPWWQELRVLLKYKDYLDDSLLTRWSEQLAEKTNAHHCVPAETIRDWMEHWVPDITVHDILNC